MAAIPFVRQFPDGKKSLVDFHCPPEVEAIACEFIARGGMYIIEELPDGKVGLAASLSVNRFQTYVENEVTDNGPGLPIVAQQLIRNSIRHLAANEESEVEAENGAQT